jgi:spermidine/putrescine transport system permease protein
MTTAMPAARRRIKLPRFALALPAWLWWVAFFLVPVGLVVFASFGRKIEGSAGRVSYNDLTLDNYRDALEGGLDGTFFKVLLQGLRTTLLGTALCLLIAFPLAYLLATKIRRGKGIVLALLAVPFFTNFLMRTLAWRIVLAPKGLISNTLLDWGLINDRLALLDTRIGVQIGVVYNYLPLMIFPLFVALDRLDPALREASRDLFANRLRTFAQVTLPLARPGIIAGAVLVFVPLAGDYITANLLGGAAGNMPGNLVATNFTQAQNPPVGAAVAVILVVSILLILAIAAGLGIAMKHVIAFEPVVGAVTAAVGVTAIAFFVFDGSVRNTTIAVVLLAVACGAVWAYGEAPDAVGRGALWGWSGVVLVFLYLPIAFIVGHSFNDNKSVEVWSGFSTKWYSSMWDNTQITGSVKSSLAAGGADLGGPRFARRYHARSPTRPMDRCLHGDRAAGVDDA